MSLHTEINFESEICGHLKASGWIHENQRDAGFVRGLCLFPQDVLAWVQQTQPDAWDVLLKNHGPTAADHLLSRLRNSLDQQGTLHVIRHGFDVLGLRKELKMAQFKPANAMNPDIMARYGANRLRVVQQVKYSTANENSIDLVLFLNGIPVATVELKTDFTQSIDDAVDQYRLDRDPQPKGQNPEPLLSFPGGAMVHFAVSSSEVRMTTRLEGPKTEFLPFNKGNDGAKGNPPNPNGYMTAYAFLSQIFDYGNTDFEKRSIFFKQLLRLLEFGREREGIDLSQVVLTHHNLRNRGKQNLQLQDKEYPKLDPLTAAGSGTIQEKQKAYLSEVIENLNTIFGADTTDGDQLAFLRALSSKCAESEKLRAQAVANSKEQFAGSPDLLKELINANIDSLDAFTELSTQVLNSPEIQRRVLALLLGPGKLWELLSGRMDGGQGKA